MPSLLAFVSSWAHALPFTGHLPVEWGVSLAC